MKTSLVLSLVILALSHAVVRAQSQTGTTNFPPDYFSPAPLPVEEPRGPQPGPLNPDLSFLTAPGLADRGIQPASDGAIAEFGRSTARWAADPTSAPAVTVTTLDGEKISFRATYLVLANRSTGESYLLAQVTNRSAGRIISPHGVLYTNAFLGIMADVRYAYDPTRNSLEQFVTFHENPALPKGVDERDLRVECWTEWFAGEPVSVTKSTLVTREGSLDHSAVQEENVELSFGSMKVVAHGKAFSIGAEDSGIPVAKSWVQSAAGASDGVTGQPAAVRRFLIEAVDYVAAKPMLEKLGKPRQQAALKNAKSRESLIALSEEKAVRTFTNPQMEPGLSNTPMLASLSGSPHAGSGFTIDFCLQECAPPPYGLFSWWEGQTGFQDSAGGNHATPVAYGVSITTGKVQQGLSFDGTGALSAPDTGLPSLDFGADTDFSIEAWIKPEVPLPNTYYGVQTIVDKRYTPNEYTAIGYAFFLLEGRLGFQLAASGSGYQNFGLQGSDLRLDGQWHHVAVTVDRGVGGVGVTLYVDNLVYGPYATGQQGNLSNSEPFFIGKHAQPGVNAGFKGGLDELSIYGRTLSQAEIDRIRNAGSAGKCGECVACAPCAQPTSALVGWWPANGAPNDAARENAVTLQNGASYTPATVDRGFYLNGTGAHAVAPSTSDLDVGLGTGFTLEAWVTPMDTQPGPIFEWAPLSGSSGVHFWANFTQAGAVYANIVDTGGAGHGNGAANVLTPGAATHIALTYVKASGISKVYANGVPSPGVALGTFTPKTDPSLRLYLGYRPNGGARFYGIIDEPSVYNRALSDSEIRAMYDAGAARRGKCRTVYSPALVGGQRAGGDPNKNSQSECCFAVVDNSTISAAFFDTHLSQYGLGEQHWDMFPEIQSPRSTSYSISTDGGASFTYQEPLPPYQPWPEGNPPYLPTPETGDAGDPMMAYDPPFAGFPNGILYLLVNPSRDPDNPNVPGVTETWKGFRLWKSEDKGQNFYFANGNVPDTAFSKADKPMVAVDTGTGSPNRHRVYMAGWESVSHDFYVAHSDNRGSTWSTRQLLDDSGSGPDITILPNGTAYVFWSAGINTLRYSWLTPGQTVWNTPRDVVTLSSTEPGKSGRPLRFAGARSDDWFLAVAHPHVTHTSGNGRIYLTYADLPEGAPTADQGDIFMMELTPQADGSLLPWPSPPARVRVNTDNTLTDQWEPSVAMSSDGAKLFIGYYSRQDDTTFNHLIKAYGAIANIANGLANATFDCFPISEKAFPPLFAGPPPVLGQPDVGVPANWWTYDHVWTVQDVCLDRNAMYAGYYPRDINCVNPGTETRAGFCADDYTWAAADAFSGEGACFYYAWCDRSDVYHSTAGSRPDANIRLAKIRQQAR